jgi:hypothetical protein
MNTSIVALLQIAAALLTGVQNNPAIPSSTAQSVVTLASHVVQLSTQATAHVPFTVPPDPSIYPQYNDLVVSPYLAVSGTYVQLGTTSVVKLENYYISFGDMNNDGLDDAGVVLKRFAPDGSVTYALGAMLNQGGILFNIADYPLGSTLPAILSHHIVDNGDYVLSMQFSSSTPAVTSTFMLLGNQLLKVN